MAELPRQRRMAELAEAFRLGREIGRREQGKQQPNNK